MLICFRWLDKLKCYVTEIVFSLLLNITWKNPCLICSQNIPRARKELSNLSRYTSPHGKLNCLKRVITSLLSSNATSTWFYFLPAAMAMFFSAIFKILPAKPYLRRINCCEIGLIPTSFVSIFCKVFSRGLKNKPCVFPFVLCISQLKVEQCRAMTFYQSLSFLSSKQKCQTGTHDR